MIYGCDEAGKGPVLGSMFVACVSGSEDSIPDGVKDSKSLTTNRIHSLADRIRENLNISTVEVTQEEIDAELMTEVSVKAFAKSIRQLNYKECDKGYIDCFINNRSTVSQRINEELSIPSEQDLIVEFGADDKYPIVSAASIIAKSERENHVSDLSDEYGDIGSGYPSDPNTRNFLKDYIQNNGRPPDCARKSWSTIDDLMEENA